MTRRASPGVGRATIGDNSGLPAHADVRTALAIEMIFEEKEKKLREEKKLARKRIESMKVNGDDTKFLKSLRDKTGSEIEELFKRNWHLVGAVHQDRYEQLDIFAPKASAPEKRAAHYTMGLLAGLQGKDLEVPPMVVGDDRQQMIEGHNEGRERFTAANTLILGQALDNAAAGKVTDGKTGAAINETAAKDFAKDTGDDPLVVAGVKYDSVRKANAARARQAQQGGGAAENPEPTAAEVANRSMTERWSGFPEDNTTWTDGQKDEFCTWYDALPAGDSPVIVGDHAGAQAEFKRLRDAVKPDAIAKNVGEPGAHVLGQTSGVQVDAADLKPKRPVPRPNFHEWDEDWLKWTGPQTMEFRRWFESCAPGFIPPITHEGAVACWRELMEEQANRASGGADDDEEWSRAEPKAEVPSEADIAAGAQALKDNGFVPSKAGRKARA